MKLKLDDSGNAALKDGKPVYIADDGRELALDAASLYATVAELGVSERAAAQKLAQKQAQLDKFAGIDLDKINKTAATADEVSKAFQVKLDEAESARKALESQLSGRIKSGLFAQSQFLATKRPDSIPTDMYEARFGQNFKVDANGNVEAFDASGKPIMSRSNPAQMASFDEAVEQLISQHPQAASLIKGTVVSGTGANPKPATAAGKTISMAAFDALNGREQNAKISDGFTIQ